MGTIAWVLTIGIAVVYFYIFNRMFNVIYFGCSGITAVFIGCFILSLISWVMIGGFIIMHWKIFAVILLIILIGCASKVNK